MFKSVKEYDEAMYHILVGIRDGLDPSAVHYFIGRDPEDFVDATEQAANMGFLSGVTIRDACGARKPEFQNSKVTYLGLQFLEKWIREQSPM